MNEDGSGHTIDAAIDSVLGFRVMASIVPVECSSIIRYELREERTEVFIEGVLDSLTRQERNIRDLEERLDKVVKRVSELLIGDINHEFAIPVLDAEHG